MLRNETRLHLLMTIGAGLWLALSTTAVALQAPAATVRGELITVMCFVGNGEKGRGADHAACALKCASEGYPLALITDEGEMYKIVGKLTADNNAALRELLAQQVVAEGVIGDEGAGKTLDASSVKRADE